MKTKNQTKVADLFEHFKKRILAGEFQAGDKLPIDTDLIRDFDCSQGTINNAMAMLAQAGLVERRPRIGTIVSDRTASTGNVGLDALAFIYPSNRHEGIWKTMDGFQKAAQGGGRRVLMFSTEADYHREAEYITRLSEFDVSAAALYPILPEPKDVPALMQMIVSSRFPIHLAAFCFPELGCPSVSMDGFHAGYTMTRHLLNQGYEKIGFLSNYSWAPNMRERYRGYLWAMQEADRKVEDGWVRLDPSMVPDYSDPIRQPELLAERYLDTARELEGVVCTGDFLAIGLIEAAQKSGISVPKQLKVTGIADYSLAATYRVPLTTYHLDFENMGRKIFEGLHQEPSLRKDTSLHQQIKGSLVVRESA